MTNPGTARVDGSRLSQRLCAAVLAAVLAVQRVGAESQVSAAERGGPEEAEAAQTLSTRGDPLAESLGALSFLNGGEVRATDTFERLTQCNGFTESYTAWDTGSVRDNLYETTSSGNASVPPVGMRSAVPLGGLGTGTFELVSPHANLPDVCDVCSFDRLLVFMSPSFINTRLLVVYG